MPNLVWGRASTSTFGSYDYKKDLIKISSVLKYEDKEVLDYVVYHELLHKTKKFKNNYGRNYYHNKDFREAESRFKNQKQIEKRLKEIAMLGRRGRNKSIASLRERQKTLMQRNKQKERNKLLSEIFNFLKNKKIKQIK